MPKNEIIYKAKFAENCGEEILLLTYLHLFVDN